MPEVAEFEPMDTGGSTPADRGKPSVSSREIARQAASEAVRGPSAAKPGGRFDSTTKPGGDHDKTLESEERQTIQFDDELEDDYQDDSEDRQTRQARREDDFEDYDDDFEDDFEDEPGLEFTHEEYAALEELGVDVPVRPDEVPEDFKDGYSRMTQSLLDTHQAAQEQILDAQEAILQVHDFKERLQTPEGQQKFLTAMALNNPDIFNQAVETVQRMQEDPEYADVVRQRMEADVKMEAATRKERAALRARQATKGRQVERRAERLAKARGLDEGFVKEQIAQRILLNEQRTGQRDISLSEVDEVVNNLARRMGPRRRRARRKDPSTQRREQQASTKPTKGAGTDAPAQGDQTRQSAERSGRTQSTDWGSKIRGAIRQSARDMRSKGL